MFNAILQQGLTLLLLAGLAFVATGLGWLVLRKANITYSSFVEQIFFSAGIGFAIIGCSVFLLGVLQLLYATALNILLVFLAILSLGGFLPLRTSAMTPAISFVRLRWENVASFLLLVCLGAGLLLVLTPEIGKDALIYHLAVPRLFLRHHGFYFIQGNIFANYPLHTEMLYLVGLFLQGDVMAKGMHFVVLLFILLGMYQFSKHTMNENTFPVLGMVVFYTIPSVFVTSHMAYNDLFVTFYAMASIFAFINWFERNEQGWLIVCGTFSGLAIATKYTALLLPLLGCLGIMWASRYHCTEDRKVLQRLFLYNLVVIVVGSPFYLKNWIMTGNPLYPFFYDIFGGKGWEAEQARLYDLFIQNLGMGRELIDYILLPLNVSFRAKMNSMRFDGLLGPIFILTLPFIIGMATNIRMKFIIAYSFATFIFWASTAQQIRYLIPIFPFLAMLTASILTYYKRRPLLFGILMLLIASNLTFNIYHIARDFLKIKPLSVVVGLESREAFLARTLPSYGMFQFANENLPRGSRILLIYMKNWTFLCDHDCYSDSMFESYTIQKILSRAQAPEFVLRELKERGFTHILYDTNYIYGNLSTFSPQGKAIFSTLQEEYLSLIKALGPYYLYRIK